MITRPLAAAGEFAFATPVGWFAIDLPDSPADVDRLARRVTAAHPGLAGQREALTEMLSSLTEATAAVGAVAAYGALFSFSGVAMPATLLVTVQPAGSPAPGTRVFDLPAGRTARIERLTELSAAAADRRPVSFTVMYVTEVPGRDQAVVLTFATPALALIDQLRPVFHQIACSLLINPAGRVQPPAGKP